MPNEQKATRKLAAILSADVKGYSILMADDEVSTVQTLKNYRSIMSNCIEQHGGRVVDAVGDNLLAEFGSAVDAVQCAVEIQKKLNEKNEDIPENRRLQFRIGVNIGDVIQDGDRIFGDGVNIAARIEGLADPGGVCISRNAYDHIRNKLNLGYEYLGEQSVKNIKQPIRVYKLLMDLEDAGKLFGEKKRLSKTKWIGVGAAATIIIFGIVILMFYFGKTDPVENVTVNEIPSIAVLPFDNLSDDTEQEYFSDGMTDDIITDLSKISGLMVISRNSTFTFKGKEIKIPAVAKELGVRYILEGSVRRADDMVRINAQLIDAVTDHHVWAERFDSKNENIFELQDKITARIVSVLAVKLSTPEQQIIADKGTNNIFAYDAYLKGMLHLRRFTPEDYVKAIEYFKQAIELDNNFSQAYADLTYIYWSAVQGGKKFWDAIGKDFFTCRILGRHYLELAMKKPTSRGYQLMASKELYKRNFKKAIDYAKHAVTISPNDADAMAIYGHVMVVVDNPEEGIKFFKKSIMLDPLHKSTGGIGHAYFTMGDYEQAIKYIEKALKDYPDTYGIKSVLASSYAFLGDNIKAKKTLEEFYT